LSVRTSRTWPVALALAAVGLLAPLGSGAATVAHPKRGIASARFLSHDPRVLTRLGANWAYNWSATAPAATGPEWVPMVWGSGSVTPSTIASLQKAHKSGRAHELLGFNEPDSGGQANMTPARAAALWPQLQRTGLSLGSPAPAVATDGWLSRFMSLARSRHLRVDFIALHYYQDFTNPGAVPDLRRQLDAIHRKYRMPIWVTEIGALDIRAWHEPMQAAPTVARAVSYMRRLFAMLDSLPYVKRYAWFTDTCTSHDCPYSAVLSASARPTRLGSAFRSAR
jgi:hypothetical protein